eukprot:COSAG01_NODE_164_length_23340_cov_76.030033_5_plen_36_part_00
MPSSSGAERCLLAPRNINDGNGDYEAARTGIMNTQ